MADDRISKLSQRFRTHAVGRPPRATRTRERHSFYLDGELVDNLNQRYRDINHELYPHSVSKSAFLEALIEHGLSHLDEIKISLSQTQDGSETS